MEIGFVLIALVAVVLIVVGFHMAGQRRKALAAWARSRGLAFDAGNDDSLKDRFAEFDCLTQGHDRYAYNRVWGDWNGRELLALDYHYQTGSGDDETTHIFSAVILTSRIPLRPLFIRPEGFFDKVGEFLGFDDIDFESAEFSRQFYVKSPDRRWAYDVIHQRAMDFLLGMPRFWLQFDRRHVIAWRDDDFKPAEFQQAAELIAGLLDRLPEYLVRQQTGRG